MIGLQDLMPTMLDIAGVAAPEGLQGRSLMPLLRGEARDWRDVAYIENETHNIMKDSNAEPRARRRQRAVFDGRFKLILEEGATVLFELETDPEERFDVSGTLPAEVSRLALRLKDEARVLEDPLGVSLAEDALRRLPEMA